ncbi:carboxypeptidase M32, partial [Bacillus sp. ZZQ-131]
MTVATYEVEKQFLTYVKKIQNYGEALSLMFWDLRTGAPKKGVDQRSEVIGMLSSEVFAMSTSDEMGNYLTELEALIREDKLSETTKKMVEECRKEY